MATLTILAIAAGISAGLDSILNLVLGSLAAALLHSVVLEVRQTSARARADLAARTATQARERSHEHIKFATAMGRQLQAARAENAQLGARTRELESRLTESEAELAQVRDALWISEAAEKRARAALVAVEQVLEDGGRHLRPA